MNSYRNKPLCNYYNPRMEILLQYCKCLYKLEGCGAGGMLHILLDDDNYRTSNILFCLNQCITHPEEPESELGILICKEYLKLSDAERALFDNYWCGQSIECPNLIGYSCKDCELIRPIWMDF